VAHDLHADAVHCYYHVTLLRGAFMRRLLDRTREMERMELCFEYPYQWGNTGGRIKHWVFLLPLDNATTKVFFMFYFDGVRVPFTPFHFPQRLMSWVLRLFNPIFIRPVLDQDGDAVGWEQSGYQVHHDQPVFELNPAVPMFQKLIVRKWRDYLKAQMTEPSLTAVERSSAP